jgi:hypothetical protein
MLELPDSWVERVNYLTIENCTCLALGQMKEDINTHAAM